MLRRGFDRLDDSIPSKLVTSLFEEECPVYKWCQILVCEVAMDESRLKHVQRPKGSPPEEGQP